MLILFALLIATPARAEGRRAIAGQASGVPLFTAMRVDEERTLGELLRFGRLERERVLPWRDRLEPVATGGDPLAQLWLARLYDLFPFGKGTPEEGRVAMTWYNRAADQHLAIAEYANNPMPHNTLYFVHKVRSRQVSVDIRTRSIPR